MSCTHIASTEGTLISAQPTTPDPAQQQGEETTPWLNSEEREAWLFLSSIIFNLTRQLEVQLQKDSGLSFVEYMVLAMLSESPTHSLTMTELATATNTLPARLSRVVTRLEKDDLVRREPSPSDRRVSICFLLKAGLQKVQQTAPGHVREVRRQIFDHLTPEQVHSLQEIGTSVLGDTPSQVISIDSLMRGTYGDTKREHADS